MIQSEHANSNYSLHLLVYADWPCILMLFINSLIW